MCHFAALLVWYPLASCELCPALPQLLDAWGRGHDINLDPIWLLGSERPTSLQQPSDSTACPPPPCWDLPLAWVEI
ncbi:hypothetical protein V8C37DRAFT_390611, partial [Trichoderma ceciliae]